MSSPPVPRRRERDREVKVGLFTLVGVLSALVLLFTLTDASTFRGRYKLLTRVDDAGGVRKGDPVQMRGVNIGRILGFQMVPGGVELTLEIEGEFRVPADSRVELVSGGLLAGRIATIEPGSAPQRAAGGATLPGVAEGGDVLGQVGTLAEQAQATLGRVQRLLSDQVVGNVEASSTSVAQMLEELRKLTSEQGDELRSLTQSLRASARGLERAVAGPELQRSIARLDKMTAQMERTLSALDRSSRSLEVVMGRMERGEGTLGRLSRDDTLYRNANEAAANLNKTASELQSLVQDVRENPRRYLNLEIF